MGAAAVPGEGSQGARFPFSFETKAEARRAEALKKLRAALSLLSLGLGPPQGSAYGNAYSSMSDINCLRHSLCG